MWKHMHDAMSGPKLHLQNEFDYIKIDLATECRAVAQAVNKLQVEKICYTAS